MFLTYNSGKNGTNNIINELKNICGKGKCSFWGATGSYEIREYNQYDKKRILFNIK